MPLEPQFYRSLYHALCSTNVQYKQEQMLFEQYAIKNLDLRTMIVLANAAVSSFVFVLQSAQSRQTYLKGASVYHGCCASCQQFISEQVFETDVLLNAYLTGQECAGILPHVGCENEWCRCRLVRHPAVDLDELERQLLMPLPVKRSLMRRILGLFWLKR